MGGRVASPNGSRACQPTVHRPKVNGMLMSLLLNNAVDDDHAGLSMAGHPGEPDAFHTRGPTRGDRERGVLTHSGDRSDSVIVADLGSPAQPPNAQQSNAWPRTVWHRVGVFSGRQQSTEASVERNFLHCRRNSNEATAFHDL